MRSSDWYRWFGQHEAAGSSPVYERLTLALADDDRVMALVDSLPPPKRQPNLLLAVARFLAAPLDDADAFSAFIVANWDRFDTEMRSRATQTNEPARCAAFLPLLARLDRPVTLIEVGCSAGLCLYPDRYAIGYNGSAPLVGSPVEVEVVAEGPLPVPSTLPVVAERIGIDLNPLDVTSPYDMAWLEACVWPEHLERHRRMCSAVKVVAADPPRLIAGDLVDTIDGVLAAVDPDTIPVVFHTAVLAYVDQRGRREFADRLADHPEALWFSNECQWVIDGLEFSPYPSTSAASFLLAEAGTTVHAVADPHGAWLRWLSDPT